MSKRDTYIGKMELQLDKLNTKMTELASNAQGAKEDARNKYKDEMTKLRHQSKVAVAKLDELKSASEDSWETLITDMEEMHDAFTHSFLSLFQIPIDSWSHMAAGKPPQKGHSAHQKKA